MVCRVVQYALQRHLPAGSTVSSQAGCLDSLLQSKHSEANAQIQASRCAKLCLFGLASLLSIPFIQSFIGVCMVGRDQPAPADLSAETLTDQTAAQAFAWLLILMAKA